MFANTVKLYKDLTTSILASIVDLSQRGRSVRKDASNNSFSISSVQTKENPGYITTRVSLRRDRRLTASVPVLSNPTVVPSVSIVLSIPQDAVVTEVELAGMVCELVNLLKLGDSPADSTGQLANTDLSAGILRLMVGEL